MRWAALGLALLVTGCGSTRPADEDAWLAANRTQIAVVLRTDAVALGVCSAGAPNCFAGLNAAEVEGRILDENTVLAPPCLTAYARRVALAAIGGWRAASGAQDPNARATRLAELAQSQARLRALRPPPLAPAALRALPGWPCL